jgi:hypothetical protein
LAAPPAIQLLQRSPQLERHAAAAAKGPIVDHVMLVDVHRAVMGLNRTGSRSRPANNSVINTLRESWERSTILTRSILDLQSFIDSLFNEQTNQSIIPKVLGGSV